LQFDVLHINSEMQSTFVAVMIIAQVYD